MSIGLHPAVTARSKTALRVVIIIGVTHSIINIDVGVSDFGFMFFYVVIYGLFFFLNVIMGL